MPAKKRTFETLAWPQHFHVGVFVYEKLDDHDQFLHSTHFDLTEYTVGKAVDRALEMAAAIDPPRERIRVHVNQVTQCADSVHVKAWPK